MKKMTMLLVHLSHNMWDNYYEDLYDCFDEGMWDYIVEQCPKYGINTILLDVGDGVEFGCHPEIAIKNAWSRTRVRKEIARCREKGLTIIPKFNFSACHHRWLAPYDRMLSTPVYYQVCNDLIKEAYTLFDKPEYIFLGFDEEDEIHCTRELNQIRKGELFWHDIRFMMDCVTDAGARPMMWGDPMMDHPEEFTEHIKPGEAVMAPWQYNSLREDHYTPVSSRPEYVEYYANGPYKDMHIDIVENDPFFVRYRKNALPMINRGYEFVPTMSVYNRCPYNHLDTLEYYKTKAPDDKVIGFITAPWFSPIPKNKAMFDESFAAFKEALDKFYPDN